MWLILPRPARVDFRNVIAEADRTTFIKISQRQSTLRLDLKIKVFWVESIHYDKRRQFHYKIAMNLIYLQYFFNLMKTLRMASHSFYLNYIVFWNIQLSLHSVSVLMHTQVFKVCYNFEGDFNMHQNDNCVTGGSGLLSHMLILDKQTPFMIMHSNM